MSKDLKDQPLGRFEAQRVARWLKDQKNKVVPGGWTGVHKLTPAQIAKEYVVSVSDIITQARIDVSITE